MSIPDIPDIAVPVVSEVVADVEFPDAKRLKSSNEFHMSFWDDTDSEIEKNESLSIRFQFNFNVRHFRKYNVFRHVSQRP